jgi:CBS domain-containing protein
VLTFSGLGTGAALGMWTAFIGWFIAAGAARAYQGVLVQEALAGVTVARLMRRQFQAVPVDASVAAALRSWPSAAGDELPVVDGDRFVGVVSTEALQSLSGGGGSTKRVSVLVQEGRDLFATPSDGAAAACRTLIDQGLDRLPVVEGGRLVGVVERADIEQWIARYVARPVPIVTEEQLKER